MNKAPEHLKKLPWYLPHQAWLKLRGYSIIHDPEGAEATRANLTRANLTGANLAGANLTGADLAWADLTRANLAWANLPGADLTRANLAGANLTGADLAWADLTRANLTGADLTRADIPTIPSIDKAILDAVKTDGCSLDMGDWHTCETAHCRAGWAITLAGEAGRNLEKKYGPSVAGALIYAKSRPNKPIPNFYASNEDAMKDIEACAAEAQA